MHSHLTSTGKDQRNNSSTIYGVMDISYKKEVMSVEERGRRGKWRPLTFCICCGLVSEGLPPLIPDPETGTGPLDDILQYYWEVSYG